MIKKLSFTFDLYLFEKKNIIFDKIIYKSNITVNSI